VQLVLVRHALPELVQGTSGRADPPLTAHGRAQAARLVAAVGPEVAALYTSPMARATATAAPLAAGLGMPPTIVDDLREYDAEVSHYVPVHEMAQLDPGAWDRIKAGLLPAYVDVPAFTARVVAALEGVVAAHEGRATAVVVAHAGVINTWLTHLLGIARPLAFPLDYTGVTRILAARDGRRSVRTVNEIAHVADLLAPVADSTAD
jgi:probable phosphoglycerate mutase